MRCASIMCSSSKNCFSPFNRLTSRWCSQTLLLLPICYALNLLYINSEVETLLFFSHSCLLRFNKFLVLDRHKFTDKLAWVCLLFNSACQFFPEKNENKESRTHLAVPWETPLLPMAQHKAKA